MVSISESSKRQPGDQRLFPQIMGRQNSYCHASFAGEQVAVGLMGEEAEDRGKRLWTVNEVATIYPQARIAMLQYTINGREETTFNFPNDRELFSIIYTTLTELGVVSRNRPTSNPGTGTDLSLVEAINKVKTGEDSEAMLYITFDGGVTERIAVKLTEYLKQPPTLEVSPFPPDMDLRIGMLSPTKHLWVDIDKPKND